MDKFTHQKLLEIDRAGATEDGWMNRDWPSDFDYDNAVIRATKVLQDLELSTQRTLFLAGDYQDAYFWGRIYDLSNPHGADASKDKPIFYLRLSSWGNLVSCRTIDSYPRITKKEEDLINVVLRNNGFLWVDGDSLKATLYDGVIQSERSPGEPLIKTWWDRFFEYG